MRGSSYRRGNFERLGGLVNTSLDGLGLWEKILEYQAMGRWREIVGKSIADSSIPEKIQDGTMYVCCKSSMWANELTLHKPDIVKRLNKAIGKRVIKDIRFSSRGFSRLAAAISKESKSTTRVKNLDKIAVDEDAVKSAEVAASGSASDELANRIKRAVLTSKRLNEAKKQEGWQPCKSCGELHDGKYDLCDNCRA